MLNTISSKWKATVLLLGEFVVPVCGQASTIGDEYEALAVNEESEPSKPQKNLVHMYFDEMECKACFPASLKQGKPCTLFTHR